MTTQTITDNRRYWLEACTDVQIMFESARQHFVRSLAYQNIAQASIEATALFMAENAIDAYYQSTDCGLFQEFGWPELKGEV